MGLLALKGCTVATLVDMYRVADRLVMEQLMVEVLEELADRELQPQEAGLVMQLAGGGLTLCVFVSACFASAGSTHLWQCLCTTTCLPGVTEG